MTDHYNGGGGETVMSHDSQMLETVPWQEGYYAGIVFGYDSRDEEHPYEGREAAAWEKGRVQGLADIYKME
ncbi:hypothetical protein [Pseudomonas avellanae]|nr:hypothetical protein [Pseudomonas avellanae]UQW77171.1 hypothetical protein L2Y01_28200 [Pseudomonas avellanae]